MKISSLRLPQNFSIAFVGASVLLAALSIISILGTIRVLGAKRLGWSLWRWSTRIIPPSTPPASPVPPPYNS